jgi:ribosomal protein S13
MQTKEEEQQQHKDAIIAFTEEVLQARGIECDSRISKISEEQLNEILEEVRQLCKKNKKSKEKDNSSKLLYNKQIE